MINDSHNKPNCKVQVIDDEGKPRLAFFSLKHIGENTELRFDYGDKTVHWRKVSITTFFVKYLGFSVLILRIMVT